MSPTEWWYREKPTSSGRVGAFGYKCGGFFMACHTKRWETNLASALIQEELRECRDANTCRRRGFTVEDS